MTSRVSRRTEAVASSQASGQVIRVCQVAGSGWVLVTSLMSAAAMIFVAELQFFQRVFDTVERTGNRWLICIGAAPTIVGRVGVRRFLLPRRASAAAFSARSAR
jgi:hypothetical protein